MLGNTRQRPRADGQVAKVEQPQAPFVRTEHRAGEREQQMYRGTFDVPRVAVRHTAGADDAADPREIALVVRERPPDVAERPGDQERDAATPRERFEASVGADTSDEAGGAAAAIGSLSR